MKASIVVDLDVVAAGLLRMKEVVRGRQGKQQDAWQGLADIGNLLVDYGGAVTDLAMSIAVDVRRIADRLDAQAGGRR
jgi:hypothetical protein